MGQQSTQKYVRNTVSIEKLYVHKKNVSQNNWLKVTSNYNNSNDYEL